MLSYSVPSFFSGSVSGKRNRTDRITVTFQPKHSVTNVRRHPVCSNAVRHSTVFKNRRAPRSVWGLGAETQVGLTQWTRSHFSTVSQWDRRKHMAAEGKLAWLSSDLACHPAAQSPTVGCSGKGQHGAEKRFGFAQIYSFAFWTASSSLPLSLQFSHIACNWLKPKTARSGRARSRLSVNSGVDVMCVWVCEGWVCVCVCLRGRFRSAGGRWRGLMGRAQVFCAVACYPVLSWDLFQRRSEVPVTF